MIYKKELIIILISLILLSTIGLFEKLKITGFTTASHELTINLTKTNYTTNEKLQGFIKIAINSPLDINSKIRISLGNQTTDYLLTDILNKSRITYAISGITEIATGQNTTNNS